MAHLYRTHDKHGRPHPRWRFQYIGHDGKRRSATGFASKPETAKLAARIEGEQDAVRKGLMAPPANWRKAGARPAQEVIEEYCTWGESAGGRRGHAWGTTTARLKRAHLKYWLGRLNLQSLGDLAGTLPAVEEAIRELQAEELTPKTLQNRIADLRAFVSWCLTRRLIREDPLAGMVGFDVTPKTERRAFTPDDLTKLFAVAPEERQPLYELALCSGLRAREMWTLTPDDLDTQRGGLHLRAETTKNRRASFQPLPWDLVGRLQEHVESGEAPEGRLIYVGTHTGREIGRDLDAAGISRMTPRGKVDLHACRVTFATLLDQAGASAKEAETLMRHRPGGITSRVYVKVSDTRIRELVEAVGEVVRRAKSASECSTGAVRKAAGAESLCLESPYGSMDAGSIPAASTRIAPLSI